MFVELLPRFRSSRLPIGLFAFAWICAAGAALAEEEHLPSGPWADWVEPGFPFFSSVLDARKAGAGLPENNLTPRGLVLNLGHGCWACFDTDLLRVAAIWDGKGVTPEALAPLSYHDAGRRPRVARERDLSRLADRRARARRSACAGADAGGSRARLAAARARAIRNRAPDARRALLRVSSGRGEGARMDERRGARWNESRRAPVRRGAVRQDSATRAREKTGARGPRGGRCGFARKWRRSEDGKRFGSMDADGSAAREGCSISRRALQRRSRAAARSVFDFVRCRSARRAALASSRHHESRAFDFERHVRPRRHPASNREPVAAQRPPVRRAIFSRRHGRGGDARRRCLDDPRTRQRVASR